MSPRSDANRRVPVTDNAAGGDGASILKTSGRRDQMGANLVLFAGQMLLGKSFRKVQVRAVALVCTIACGLGPGSAYAGHQEAQPQGSTNGSGAPTLDPSSLPVDVNRIQRALSRPPAIRLESERSVFRIEIFARKPTIEDILGRDFLKGPVPYGGMSHQEFLDMVTPSDVRGYAAFSNKQAMTVAATSLALQWALQKAIQKFNEAKEERAKAAAKKEVEEALAELRRARRAAGLPDK
jgi:hypothetical protein